MTSAISETELSTHAHPVVTGKLSYLDFFGLQAPPFRNASGVSDPFFNRTLRSAQERIDAALDRLDSGLIIVNGEAGAGKTTLVNHLANRRAAHSVVARINHMTLDEPSFLQTLLLAFGRRPDARTRNSSLADRFSDFLCEQEQAGRAVILVIDEAQNLKTGVLEWLPRLMTSREEMPTRFSIILVGQDTFCRTLALHVGRSFKQFIRDQIYLTTLDLADTGAYIRHQMKTAGYGPQTLFTESSVRHIHLHTGGSFRRINTLCDFVLFNACQRGVCRVTPELVGATLKALQWQSTDDAGQTSTASGTKPPIATLILEFDNNATFPLSKPTVSIGRAADNDLCIRDLRVSRYHARLLALPHGICIEDLGSTNGVHVNQTPVQKQVLQDGDCITIDTHRIRFSQPDRR
ncbi:AAA family ATPase [Thiobaca trueperi]|uniref:Type II secretory pathway predicted ATPase ExeA n=1 Tax=Thiobaca trueperi TaxID=127458 RepID=A0A4R3N4G7_9GAMM|nr:AAA family ATPase [Thiobaca trueperi]TCT24068.1 type II secretory pathway predicted ATPase ExeA [Thiobaca trueperi]